MIDIEFYTIEAMGSTEIEVGHARLSFLPVAGQQVSFGAPVFCDETGDHLPDSEDIWIVDWCQPAVTIYSYVVDSERCQSARVRVVTRTALLWGSSIA